MPRLKFALQGQSLIDLETGKAYPLTNGEYEEVAMMLSWYHYTVSRYLSVEDNRTITNGHNRYLETFTK
jgi:hypothetical protein